MLKLLVIIKHFGKTLNNFSRINTLPTVRITLMEDKEIVSDNRKCMNTFFIDSIVKLEIDRELQTENVQ